MCTLCSDVEKVPKATQNESRADAQLSVGASYYKCDDLRIPPFDPWGGADRHGKNVNVLLDAMTSRQQHR
jgi:hypothetical protein